MRPALLVLLLALGAARLPAQQAPVQWYALNVFIAADEGSFNASGVQDFQRLRVMFGPKTGVLALDAAYEQLLTLTSTAALGAVGSVLGTPGGSGDWLPLQGTLDSGTHVLWRHRVDRLAVTLTPPVGELTVGRQTVSWATTLFLTPADPFAPFDPADPFREYRPGVDAARLRVFPGALSEVEAVVRPSEFAGTTTMTALARGRIAVGRAEIAGWGGVLHDEPAGAVAGTLSVLGGLLRAEAALRRSGDETVLRMAVGANRSFEVAGRTLYLVAEYQRDGFGARDAGELASVFLSEPFRRSELQVLGRDEFAMQASYQVHPLVSVQALALWNAGDGSVLAAPAVAYDALASVSVRFGAFLGIGGGRTDAGMPASEYGVVPLSAYLSGSAFF